MNFIRKILKHEYGIYVKKIRLRGTMNYYGDVYYLPYCIESCMAGSIVAIFNHGQVYKSLDSIIEKVKREGYKGL